MGLELYSDEQYIFNGVFNSGSPFQAFRGYREGVKMSLDEGKTVDPEEFKKRIWP